MTRSFTVDNTLGFLQTSVPRLFLPPGGRDLTIAWKLTRPASVVVTVETKAGEVVRTLALRRYEAADQSVVWNGLDRQKKRVKGGVYRAHVVREERSRHGAARPDLHRPSDRRAGEAVALRGHVESTR